MLNGCVMDFCSFGYWVKLENNMLVLLGFFLGGGSDHLCSLPSLKMGKHYFFFYMDMLPEIQKPTESPYARNCQNIVGIAVLNT